MTLYAPLDSSVIHSQPEKSKQKFSKLNDSLPTGQTFNEIFLNTLR